ncbi:hypothetical protein GCM10023321_37590 [Pseudonocardia eucalypti]|uniref:Uncharacterized protein n=1 Tax=Pseudonocardia eucalypti TaxID=648755 RepID=A0ABP9QC28_9PSEU|nr:uncharacterized BrkB/YihY/UPF0761 family membrane protein [Pseudonocardia eucalypti]
MLNFTSSLTLLAIVLVTFLIERTLPPESRGLWGSLTTVGRLLHFALTLVAALLLLFMPEHNIPYYYWVGFAAVIVGLMLIYWKQRVIAPDQLKPKVGKRPSPRDRRHTDWE